MLELAENLEGFSPEHNMEDPYLQCIKGMPFTFDEMIDTMGVIYRNNDAFNWYVECYNDIKMIPTKMKIYVAEEGLECDESE